MDFNVKKFVGDAGTLFTRAVQVYIQFFSWPLVALDITCDRYFVTQNY